MDLGDVAGNLITLYLSTRHQKVFMLDKHSGWSSMESGVSQGLVLGPLLFLLYVNHLPSSINSDHTCRFACDTSFLNIGVDNKNATEKTKNSLVQVHNWFMNNAMRMNQDKTFIFTVDTRSRPKKQKFNTKFLALILTNDLRWNNAQKTY